MQSLRQIIMRVKKSHMSRVYNHKDKPLVADKPHVAKSWFLPWRHIDK